ncbi:MAG: radical SAM/Cys-rich domain protein [Alphaproteobacteria bacterium]|nr:radical SAM/Cys-rich domain protein [Alphaproteobacteria bacterium]
MTGGAPELNPNFKYFVTAVRDMGIDRCNLTVLLDKDQEDTARFLADNKVEIIALLPCYTKENVDAQRGSGTFEKSIKALRLLNDIGYGKNGGDLILNLVYNPGGAFLPGCQYSLEEDYKKQLKENYGVEFTNLFTITNMPINRFKRMLKKEVKLDAYRQLLMNNFNISAAVNVMCSKMISVGWDGTIYDCDFNQMLEKPITGDLNNIFKISKFSDIADSIVLHDACYGGTAGNGSSCGGSLTQC